MDQENDDNASSRGCTKTTSSLISKRVSSAGALVRQQTIPVSSATVSQYASSLSDGNLSLSDTKKFRLGDQQLASDEISKAYSRMDSSSNTEIGKPLNSDYNELKARYATMESAYEVDRQKTSILLAKKDAHISRLQDRVVSLEHRLEVAMQKNPENNHGLIAERDALLDKVRRLEAAFAAEKSTWETSLRDSQSRLVTAEKEFLKLGCNKEVCNALNVATDVIQPVSTSNLCSDCSYVRGQLERTEKTISDLLRDKEQLQQENQRKETVLSELSAEATELRVQLNSFNDERTALKRRIRYFEEEYARQRTSNEKRIIDPVVVVDENLLLRRRLDETRNYFEAMDIESEQQITSLTNQLEDLHSTLEEKQRDMTLLRNRVKELEQERDAALAKVKTAENNFSRQQDVIEGLRDDLDRQRDKQRELAKDRDDLLLRNASLSHEVEIVQREAQMQRDEIHSHLAHVSRELEQCKTKLHDQEELIRLYDDDDGLVSKFVTLNSKIDELESALQDRDGTIRMQQHRLNELKKALQKEWKLALESSCSASMPSGLDRDAENTANGLSRNSPDERLQLHFQCLKNVILRFVTSNEYESTQLVRAVAALLCLTPEEEQLIWNSLKWRMSWSPTGKPKLTPT